MYKKILGYAALLGLVGIGAASTAPVVIPQAFIQWQAPTFYVDGVYLPPENIAYFTVYMGPVSQSYTEQWQVSSLDREGFIPLSSTGVWYIAMTATDINGEESTYSNEVMRDITAPGSKKPRRLTVQMRITK